MRTQLACVPEPRSSSIGREHGSGTCRLAIATALLGGLWPASYAGLVGFYLAMLIPLAMLAVLGRREALVPTMERWRALRLRRQRLAAQRRRIERVDIARLVEHTELTAIVDEVESSRAPELASLGLTELLGHYVELIEARQRLVGATMRAEARGLGEGSPTIGQEPGPDVADGRGLQDRLCRRRAALSKACRARAAQLEAQLGATVEFIRLVGAHAFVSPLEVEGGDLILGKLSELDELLDARQELATLTRPRPSLVGAR